MQPLITIFGQEVSTYFLMIMIGYGAGLFVVLHQSKINSMLKTDALVAYILAGFGALIGGKLFFVIQGISTFIELNQTTGLSFLDFFTNAGLVYYGGFIGAVLMVMLFSLLFKIRFWTVIDTLIPALPLAQAFGRVGCFLAGCCYGVPHEHGVLFPFSDTPLLPTQLYETACVTVLFVIMMVYGKQPRRPGKLLGMYMIGYGIIRFVLEFFRGDEIRGFAGGLSVSQWISIAVLAAGVILFFFYKPATKKTQQPLTAS